MRHFTDQQLINEIRHDDPVAFEVLFDRYWDKLYRAGMTRLDDAEDTQDILQEVFISIWNRRQTLLIKDSVEGYLMGALKLAILSFLRSKKVKQAQLSEALKRVNILEEAVSDLTDYLDLECTLDKAVSTMPEMLRRVYQLRSENRSIREIASELGIADQTVKNYIGEVIRRLRAVLSEQHPEQSLGIVVFVLTMLKS